MRALRDKRIILLVAGTYAYARLAGGRPPFFIFYLSACLWLACWIWTYYTGRSLSCLIRLDKTTVQKDEQLTVRVRLDNEALVSIPWLEVDVLVPSPLVRVDSPAQAASVPPAGSRILNLQITARRRGHYTVGPIRVSTGDPFGLYRLPREFQSRAAVTVYPKIWRLTGLPIPMNQPFGPVRIRQLAFEDPSNPAGIRPYRPGDSPRHIHWRTTARKGELMLKQYELQATTQLLLVVDLQAAVQRREGDRDTAETAIEVAASLANLGLERGFEVGLAGHGSLRHAVPLGRGQRTFAQIMETLTRVEADGGVALERVLHWESAFLPPHSGVVVITPHLDGPLADVILRLAGNHAVSLVVLRAESFGGNGDVDAQSRDALALTLAARRVTVYSVGAGDDLRTLQQLQINRSVALSPEQRRSAGAAGAGPQGVSR